jgi:AraC family L-rhamnose operon transcriptional activator RhaR
VVEIVDNIGMTDLVQYHLLRSQIFGTDRSLLFVSGPISQLDGSAHDHDFLEIVLVVDGIGTHGSALGIQPILRGDFFVLRPGAWHDYRDCSDLVIYNCCCAAELLRRELALLADDPAVTRLLWTEPLAPGARGVLYRRLTDEQTRSAERHLQALSSSPDEPFTVRAGRLLVLLGQLAHDVFPNEPGGNGIHVAVRQGVQLLEDGCDEAWDLARLARLTRLNPSYLTRLFKIATGRAPMQYLARHRAERAANLLLATDLSIGQVGARVGWNDPNYFARRFKSVFGVTPSAYRDQHISRPVR